MSTEYWWCWLGIAVNLAYILLLNGIIILCLAFLPAYGSSATIAKTAEELEDRRAALYGDGSNADDVVINLPAYGAGVGENGSGNAEPMIQVAKPCFALTPHYHVCLLNCQHEHTCLALSACLPACLLVCLSVCLSACLFELLSGSFLYPATACMRPIGNILKPFLTITG